MTKRIPQCVICFEELELRELAPCDDCGHADDELDHFTSKQHNYSRFNVYGAELVLCNFCDVDFSSYKPEYWGFASSVLVGYGSEGFRKIEEIDYKELKIKKGWFCPVCGVTQKMAEALAIVRARSQC